MHGDDAHIVEPSGSAPLRLYQPIHRLISVASASDPHAAQRGAFLREPPSDRPGRDAAADGPSPQEFEAAIFDMDGVLTRTAAVHSLAWKRMFDDFLRARAESRGEPFREFTHAQDYLAYVDGRPRDQGVEAFLRSRGIALPPGSPEDPPERETIHGLGNRKNAHFNRIIAREGVALYDSTVDLIRDLRGRGIRTGLATSSRNSAVILGKTGTARLFDTVVDGLVSEKLRLRGKPEPDIFAAAAGNLGVPCARAIVIEDAVSGVQAGARGGFGLVIGVARENNIRELQENGADLVVRDLAEIHAGDIDRLVRAKRAGTRGRAPFPEKNAP